VIDSNLRISDALMVVESRFSKVQILAIFLSSHLKVFLFIIESQATVIPIALKQLTSFAGWSPTSEVRAARKKEKFKSSKPPSVPPLFAPLGVNEIAPTSTLVLIFCKKVVKQQPQ
jgi:hypothetical protein